MSNKQPLSYEEFVFSPLTVSQLVQYLINTGVNQRQLEQLARRADYIYLPGSRAYYVAETFIHLWMAFWGIGLSFILICIFIPPSVNGQVAALSAPFLRWWLIVSVFAVAAFFHVYHQPDYYSGNYYTRGQQEYAFYLLLVKRFQADLKQINFQPA